VPNANQAKIVSFVDGHIRIAAAKPAAQAEQHLRQWAARVEAQQVHLYASTLPAHLVGVDALDLQIAHERLIAAIPQRVAA
jgi:hypothetical protein